MAIRIKARQIGLAFGVQQRPRDVAGQEQFRIAHAGDGLVVRHADLFPGAVRRLLLHQPGLRPVDDPAIDRIHLGHVVELLQAISADPDQRFVRFLECEPQINDESRQR